MRVRAEPGFLSPGFLSPGFLSPGFLSPGFLSPGFLSPGFLSQSSGACQLPRPAQNPLPHFGRRGTLGAMTRSAPTLRQRLNDRRAAMAWWGLLALLIQVMVPLGQAVPAVGADGLPRSLVLCSADGLRSVPMPGSGAPARPDASSCAVCLAYAAGGATDIPNTPAQPFPPAAAGVRIDQPAILLAQGLTPGLPRARSPPAVV